ncbi:type IV secretion system DNA-binding domain-containing protein [Candidatus Nomurabacteria bacterium]|nr:type IV secretion system DNA-binding domain-containing protein [Candidatus Nomurabacteria bacterium]
MPAPQLRQASQSSSPEDKVTLFAATNYRNQMRKFGIKTDDRRRHMYIIGKTGMGKSTMMENMMLHDIYMGHGVGLVDPHGDFAEKMIDYIPSWRINDIIYVNPADVEFPMGFNVLEVKNEKQKHLIASGLMATFKKIWPDVWSSRMEYILNNTLLALLDYPGSTLLGINRLLADEDYRKRVVGVLKDPIVKAFWKTEFAGYSEKYATEAVAPIQNKIGQFLSASVIRNMVAQVKSTFDVREAMDSNKIIIMNLSKGRIGEDNSRLLGGMLVTKIQLAAMERVDIPEHERKDFFLYVDEFQNFATPSFANILSEARKYRLSLIMAHQYVAQLDEVVADAVFGNVGTIVSFRVGGADAQLLAQEFAPTFIEEDIVNLAKFQIFLKLMIDGVASMPFSATTLPPIANRTGSAQKVIQVSRERYGKPREKVEDKVSRWSSNQDDEEDLDAAQQVLSETITIERADPASNPPQKPTPSELAQKILNDSQKQKDKKQDDSETDQLDRQEFTRKKSTSPSPDSKPVAEEEKDKEKSESSNKQGASDQDGKTDVDSSSASDKPKKKRRRRRKKKKKEDDDDDIPAIER